jgi:hypothetical protein
MYIEIIKEIGAWIDRLNNRSERYLSLHTETSAALRLAVTETRIFLANSPAKSNFKNKLADLARTWTDVSTKVQTLAHASKSDDLRSLASDCMKLAEMCASLDVPEAIDVENVFKSATRSHIDLAPPNLFCRVTAVHCYTAVP